MKPKICIVVSDFYPEISNNLLKGSLNKIKQEKITNIKIIKVPGTLEIPVIVSNFINKYDAFIVLGCVIKGETPHFNYLCSSVFQAILNLSINSKVPIGNGILTCNNKKQAIQRANPKLGDKGGDAAKAIISVLNLIK